MTHYILDASAMGPLIIPDELNALIADLPDILASDQALVPQHWRLEVANLGRMAVRKKRMTEPLLREVLASLSVFTVIVDTETDRAAWTSTLLLAASHDLTAYDAAYLELAIRTARTIVTNDKALIRAAEREQVGILTA